ncbi:MAG: right-handed parallel beta-helix repeat-containing protein, partial [Candidatus Omnitrophica bacterium]|nr:right-handed parallel beta-helix repeat-containing protein [Candidatus Omnitrophota bacterium]
ASSTGDEVWVRSATYVENVTIEHPLTLLGGFVGDETEDSERDWESNETTIEGNLYGPVIRVWAFSSVLVDGMVITKGSFTKGGGVWGENATIEINNCELYENNGGGIGIRSGTGTIRNCNIHDNNGSVRCIYSRLTVENTAFRNNDSGALSISGSTSREEETSVIIDACVFTGNTSSGGGAIYAYQSDLVIQNTLFDRNTAYYERVWPIFPGPPIPQPLAYGGAISLFDCPTRIENSLFLENRSDTDGSCYIRHGTEEVKFINCLIRYTGNLYGILVNWSTSGRSPTFINCILQGGGGIPRENERYGRIGAKVQYTNITGGYPGKGNIDTNPLFVDPENGDFRIQRASPCVDSGTDTGLSTDFEGNPRPIGDYDMGAFEFPFLRSDLDGNKIVDKNDLIIFSQDWGKVVEP